MIFGLRSTVIDVAIEIERILCSLRKPCHLEATERNSNAIAEEHIFRSCFRKAQVIIQATNQFSSKRFVHFDAESSRTTSMVEHIYQSGVSGIPIVVERSRRINDSKVNITRLRSLGNSQVTKVAQLAIGCLYLDNRFSNGNRRNDGCVVFYTFNGRYIGIEHAPFQQIGITRQSVNGSGDSDILVNLHINCRLIDTDKLTIGQVHLIIIRARHQCGKR